MTPNTVESVWLRVDRRGPDECWPWTGGRQSGGYGSMRLRRKNVRAHRIAFQSATGIDPGALMVMHTCDNPPCCNPSHLKLGTVLDNNRDSKAKGRNKAGERHHAAKLTEAEARQIRERRKAGERGIDLASEFGVTPQLVSLIVKGRIWGAA